MSAMTSQITSTTIVYSTVYSGADKKKTSKPRVTGICEGNSPVTGEFPTQRASNAGNISIWWRHHILRWNGFNSVKYEMAAILSRRLQNGGHFTSKRYCPSWISLFPCYRSISPCYIYVYIVVDVAYLIPIIMNRRFVQKMLKKLASMFWFNCVIMSGHCSTKGPSQYKDVVLPVHGSPY